jgi:hypothetical protein
MIGTPERSGCIGGKLSEIQANVCDLACLKKGGLSTAISKHPTIKVCGFFVGLVLALDEDPQRLDWSG